MTKRGWISLHRKIQEHDFYLEKRKFSKFEAWIDLLMSANHKDNKFMLGNEFVEVKTGQLITSIRKLGARWDWSNKKVTGFLKLLESDQMVSYESNRKRTLITIENYTSYQGQGNTKETQKKHEGDTKETQMHTNNNDNNYNKFKEEEKGTSPLTEIVRLYQENIAPTESMTPIERKMLMDASDNYSLEIIELAFLEAISHGVKKWRYIEKCLMDWDSKGLKTKKEVLDHIERWHGDHERQGPGNKKFERGNKYNATEDFGSISAAELKRRRSLKNLKSIEQYRKEQEGLL